MGPEAGIRILHILHVHITHTASLASLSPPARGSLASTGPLVPPRQDILSCLPLQAGVTHHLGWMLAQILSAQSCLQTAPGQPDPGWLPSAWCPGLDLG